MIVYYDGSNKDADYLGFFYPFDICVAAHDQLFVLPVDLLDCVLFRINCEDILKLAQF